MLLHGIKKLFTILGYKITDTSLADTEIHIHLEPYKRSSHYVHSAKKLLTPRDTTAAWT